MKNHSDIPSDAYAPEINLSVVRRPGIKKYQAGRLKTSIGAIKNVNEKGGDALDVCVAKHLM